MSTSIIVRIVIIIYLMIGGWIAIFLWRNPASSDSLKAIGVIAASLVPAILVIAPLIKSKMIIKEDINAVIFFSEKHKTVIPTLFTPYSDAYCKLTANLDSKEIISREINDDEVEEGNTKEYWNFYHNEKGLDLMERLILYTIVDEFYGHWNITKSNKLTPTGTNVITKYGEEKKENVELIDFIRDNYAHNELMQKNRFSITHPSFSIPQKCKVEAFSKDVFKPDDKQIRIITFEMADNSKMTISLMPNSSGLVNSGVWGLFPPNDDIFSLEYKIEIKLEYRENSINSKLHKNWFDNMISVFKKIEWETIDKEIEKGLMRKLITQTD